MIRFDGQKWQYIQPCHRLCNAYFCVDQRYKHGGTWVCIYPSVKMSSWSGARHCLNHYWLIANWILRAKFSEIWITIDILPHESTFQNVLCKIPPSWFKARRINIHDGKPAFLATWDDLKKSEYPTFKIFLFLYAVYVPPYNMLHIASIPTSSVDVMTYPVAIYLAESSPVRTRSWTPCYMC